MNKRHWLIVVGLLSIWPYSGNAASSNSSLELNWPVNYVEPWTKINSPFGPRLKASENNRYDFHRGIDILGSPSDPVLAMSNGVVFGLYEADDANSAYPTSGNVVVLEHTFMSPFVFHGKELSTYYTLYFHLDRFAEELSEGAEVQAGDVIGYIGSTGETDTEHLHFEVRLGTSCSLEAECNTIGFDPHINPMRFLEYPQTNRAYLRLRRNGKQLRVQVRIPRTELDFNTMIVTAKDRDSKIIGRKILNLNKRKGIDPSSTETLDTPTYRGITIRPRSFSRNVEYKVLRFDINTFFTRSVRRVTVTMKDVHGNTMVKRQRKKSSIQLGSF